MHKRATAKIRYIAPLIQGGRMHLSLAEVIMIVLAAGQLIYAILDYRSRVATMPVNQARQHRHPTLVIALFMIFTWAVAAFEYVDHHYLYVPQTQENYIQAWGLTGNSYMFTVNTKELLQYSEAYKLAFVIRDRDRMTDTVIEKSSLYTIRDNAVILAHPSSNTLRFIINQANPIEYTLILVPSMITVEQISSLGDVEHIGGRILATMTQITPIGGPPATPPSQSK